MKYIQFFLLLPLILVIACQRPIPEAVNGLAQDTTGTTKRFDLIYDYLKVFPNETQVSLAFVSDSKVEFYGVKRVNDTLFLVENSNAEYEIGSITKIFTSTLLANYAIAGKLSIEDDINDYLDIHVKDNTRITFQQLASHTSGLPREASNALIGAILNPQDPYTKYDELKLQKYLRYKLSLPNDSVPHFSYSNIGYGILGYVLCQIEDRPYEDILQQYIFSKFDMKHSTTKLEKVEQEVVSGLSRNGKEVPNWNMNISILVSAGGILSNVEDLSKFVVAHFDESNEELVLSRSMTFNDSTSVPNMKGIGLGWIILEGDNNTNWYWHNGGTHGYRSTIVMDVINKHGVVILSNVSTINKYSNNIDQLGFELLKLELN